LSFLQRLKFNLNRFLIALRLKKERYQWTVLSTELNQGRAVFRNSANKREVNYRQYKKNINEELELSELITTINEFLDISENSDNYKSFVASYYKNQGYTVWEYSKDKKLNLVLKKGKNITLVKCKNDKVDINIDTIKSFEAICREFLDENRIFENYSIKLRFTMSGMFLEESAYEYIKENSDSIEYNIIKMNIKREALS